MQEAAEPYLVDFLGDASKCAMFGGRQQQTIIMVKDIQLTRRIRSLGREECIR